MNIKLIKWQEFLQIAIVQSAVIFAIPVCGRDLITKQSNRCKVHKLELIHSVSPVPTAVCRTVAILNSVVGVGSQVFAIQE